MKPVIEILIFVVPMVSLWVLVEHSRKAQQDVIYTPPEPEQTDIASVTSEREDYVKIPYSKMREHLHDLASRYPQVVQLSNSEEMFGIKHEVDCEENKR